MKIQIIKKYLPYLVIGVLLIYVVFLKECSGPDQDVKTTVTEETTIDSTTVDSLTKRITYLESLPPETTKVEVPIPTLPDTVYKDSSGADVKEYTSTHTDSVITAEWTIGITGDFKYQDFEYSLHHRPVVRETKTKYVTKYQTTTRTIEKTLQPNPYLSVGLEVGGNKDLFMASPTVSWTTSKGNSYHFKYDVINEAYMVGFKVPIRLRKISLF